MDLNYFDYDYENVTAEEALDLLRYHEERRRLHNMEVARWTQRATELLGYNYDFEEAPEVEAIINPQDDED